MVRQEPLRCQLVAMFRSPLRDAGKARTDLDTLDRIDTHHRMGDVRVEPVEHGLAESGWHSGGNGRDPRADRIAITAQLVDHRLEFRYASRFAAEKRVGVDLRA